MVIDAILLLTLVAYSVIVSQSFMYILSLKNVQLNLDINAYIQVRKHLNANMNSKFRYVTYIALLSNLALVIFMFPTMSSPLFSAAVVGFAGLIVDTSITVKGNLPINAIMDQWSSENYPKEWAMYRYKWLWLFKYRQIANVTGFLALLIGAILR